MADETAGYDEPVDPIGGTPTAVAPSSEPQPAKPFYGNSDCARCKKHLYGKKTFSVPSGSSAARMIVCEACAYPAPSSEPSIPADLKGQHKRARDYAFKKAFYGYLVSELIERIGRAEDAVSIALESRELSKYIAAKVRAALAAPSGVPK